MLVVVKCECGHEGVATSPERTRGVFRSLTCSCCGKSRYVRVAARKIVPTIPLDDDVDTEAAPAMS